MYLNETDPTIKATIKAFLRYSLDPIDLKYDDLTPTEKALCTREEFEKMVEWLKAN